MGTYPMVKFMASPASTATVRFDFNAAITSGQTLVLHNEGFDLGSPPLEGDPDGIEVGYGLRQVAFTLRVNGTRANALAAQTRLARELRRPDNWLMVKLASDRDAVWFHTFRADSAAISLDHVTDRDTSDAWDIRLQLSAEPFAWGEKVTLGPYTVLNEPAAGENLIPNPSAEVNTTGWTTNNGALTRVTTPTAFGVGAFAMTCNGAGTGDVYSPAIPVTASTSYTYFASLRRAGGSARTISVVIEWYNSAGAFISSSASGTVSPGTGAWTVNTVTGTSPSTAASAFCRVAIDTPANGEIFYVDGNCLTRFSGQAYGDGASTGWYWSGTANLSASYANACRTPLADILGDAAAPLTMNITPSLSWTDNQPLTVVVPHLDGMDPGALVWQTSGFTAGTDTTLSTADATMSGGTRSTITFATNAALVTRLSNNVPSTPPPGKYKILCRMARSDTTTTWAVRLGFNFGLASVMWGDTKFMQRTTSGTTGYSTYMDLGEFSLPLGAEGWSAAEVGAASTPDIQLQVQRLTGSGSVYVDCFVLIPISGTTTQVDARSLYSLFEGCEISNLRNGIWDADKERFRAMDFGIQMHSDPAPNLRGQYPRVIPGADNVLYLHHQIDATTPDFLPAVTENRDTLTATAAVTLWYYPRWQWLGDG